MTLFWTHSLTPISCLSWPLPCGARRALSFRGVGLKHAYSIELKLLNGVFLAIVMSPFLVLGLGTLQGSGVNTVVNVNLSDMVVAHYLNGGFQMKASEFEQMLLMRDTFTQNVVGAVGWVAWAAIAAFLIGFVIGLVRLIYSVCCLHRIVSQKPRLAQLRPGPHSALGSHPGAILDPGPTQLLCCSAVAHVGPEKRTGRVPGP